MGEARGETEARRAFLALTSVLREGRALARPGPRGAAAQHLLAQDYTGAGKVWKESSGEGTVFARLAALQPGSVPTPTSSPPSLRSLLPPRAPEALSRLGRNRKARRGLGHEPGSRPGPDADPCPVGVQASLRPGPVPPPPPPDTDTILGRDIPQLPVPGPRFGRLSGWGRQELGTPTPLHVYPARGCAFNRLGVSPTCPKEWGRRRGPGRSHPGGRRGEGVVDQVGEGWGYLPAPPGGGAKGGYLPQARLLVPLPVRAETRRSLPCSSRCRRRRRRPPHDRRYFLLLSRSASPSLSSLRVPGLGCPLSHSPLANTPVVQYCAPPSSVLGWS